MVTYTLGPDDHTARRSDGVSIAWLLSRDPVAVTHYGHGEPLTHDVPSDCPLCAEHDQPTPGWQECKDPHCTEWGDGADDFWSHLHRDDADVKG